MADRLTEIQARAAAGPVGFHCDHRDEPYNARTHEEWTHDENEGAFVFRRDPNIISALSNPNEHLPSTQQNQRCGRARPVYDVDVPWLLEQLETARRIAVELEQELALAREFRVPLTNQAGGYGEVVVESTDGRGGWAVTDGAVTGRRAWADGDWRYISDIGRAGAYRYTLDEALVTAHQVAEYEGAATEAWVKALRAKDGGAA